MTWEEEETATFDCKQVTRETDKAIECILDIDGTVARYWIPKSQIDDDSEVWSKGDVGELVVTMWIAKEKGLL